MMSSVDNYTYCIHCALKNGEDVSEREGLSYECDEITHITEYPETESTDDVYICGSNIKKISHLPENVLHLTISGTDALKKLPRLPKNLYRLTIKFCGNLAELPELPESLKCLEIEDTPIECIHPPAGLKHLVLKSTEIEQISPFPPKLETLELEHAVFSDITLLPHIAKYVSIKKRLTFEIA